MNVTRYLTQGASPAPRPQMSGLRQPEMQAIMSPREQTQGQHQGSWPRELPSLDGTTRKAPQHPGQPDKEALCSPRDMGHSPLEQPQPRNKEDWLQYVVLICASLWSCCLGALCFSLSLCLSFSPSNNTSSRHQQDTQSEMRRERRET